MKEATLEVTHTMDTDNMQWATGVY